MTEYRYTVDGKEWLTESELREKYDVVGTDEEGRPQYVELEALKGIRINGQKKLAAIIRKPT